jgi:hypothetical protein
VEISLKSLDCSLVSKKGRGLFAMLREFLGFWNCFPIEKSVELVHGAGGPAGPWCWCTWLIPLRGPSNVGH